jgi:hypothetical protein
MSNVRNTNRSFVKGHPLRSSSGHVRGAVVDVSGAGVRLSSEGAVIVGKQVHVAFDSAQGPIELVGEVRWTRRHVGTAFHSGVKVTRIDGISLDRLQQLSARGEDQPV